MMMTSDPIADMLTRIRNANTAKHDTVDIPASKIKVAIAGILVDEGFIEKYDIVEDGKITEVKLHPIDLGMEKSRGTRGRPALSRSQETLEYLAKLSEPYGVSIDIEEGVGTIRL